MRGICALENPDQAVLDRIIAKLLIPTVDGTVASTSTATVDPDTGAAVPANTPNGKLVTIGSRRFPGAALRAERATTGVMGAASNGSGWISNTASAEAYPSVRTIIEDTGLGTHNLAPSAVALTNGVNYTASCYYKSLSNNRNLQLRISDGTNFFRCFVHRSTGLSNTGSGGTGVLVRASARLLSTGYWFVQVTGSGTWSASATAIHFAETDANGNTYTGDGVSSISISGYQVELGDYATMPLAWDGSAGVSRVAQLNSWNQSLSLTAGTVFAVGMPYGRSGLIGSMVNNLFETTSDASLNRYDNSSGAYAARRVDALVAINQAISASTPAVAGQQKIITQRFDATSNRITVDGVTVSSAAPTLPFAAATPITIGNRTALDRYFDGHVFLAITRPDLTLTDAELSYLGRYVRIN